MSDFAWVTLATNDSYSLGALVLAHSLKQVGTKHQLVVLITPGVTNAMREKLTTVFNVVEEVNPLDSKDEANLKLLKRPELGITFTKLHCWRLIQFQKCVFLDADTLVLSNSDELFEREEFSAAPDVGWPDCFNSGVFVYKPSIETYSKLVDFALLKGSFDGGDQGLLNLYFSDWAHKDIAKHLPFIYNMCSTAVYSYLPAFKQYGQNAKIVHFIGPAKPWLQYFNTETLKVYPSPGLQHLEETLQKWWNIFCSLIHPNLSKDMSGLAGAFAQFTLGAKRTTGQDALENHLRKQAWELGNIDYLGRDSFDNIWSKICESMATPTQEASGEQKAETMIPEVVGDVPTTVTTTPETCITAIKTESGEPTPADVLLKEILPIPVEAVQSQALPDTPIQTQPTPTDPPKPSPADILLKEIIPIPIEAMQSQPLPSLPADVAAQTQPISGECPKPDEKSLPSQPSPADILLKEIIPIPIEAIQSQPLPSLPADSPTQTQPISTESPKLEEKSLPSPSPADVLLKEIIPIPIEAIQTQPIAGPPDDATPKTDAVADVEALLKELIPTPTAAPVDATKKETASVDVPKPEMTPVDVPKPEIAPVDAPKSEIAPVDVSKPEIAPVDVPKSDIAPVDVSKPEIAPVDVLKQETAPVDVPKPESAPVEAPKIEAASTDLDVSQPALSEALKAETTSIVAPETGSAPVEASKVEATSPVLETTPTETPKVETVTPEEPKTAPIPLEAPKAVVPEQIIKPESAVSTIITPPTPTESNKIETPTKEVVPEMLSKPQVVEVPEAIPEKDRVPPQESQKKDECPMKKECSKTEEKKPEKVGEGKPSETIEQKPESTEEVVKVKGRKIRKVPKGDASKSDPSKGDTSKGDVSKGDASKGDASKVDASKSHASKGDVSKGDASKGDASKGDASKGDALKTDTSKGVTSKTDASKGDASKSDAPKSEAPKSDASKGEAPKSDVGTTASEEQPKAGGETSTPTPPPRKTPTVKKVKAKKP